MIDILEANEASVFRHGLHEYIYNHGSEPVGIFWGDDKSNVLEPGDSAYVQPMIPHGFFSTADPGSCALLVMRCQGFLTDNVLTEFSIFPAGGRHRVTGETGRWF